jgi:hypothetical protein
MLSRRLQLCANFGCLRLTLRRAPRYWRRCGRYLLGMVRAIGPQH